MFLSRGMWEAPKMIYTGLKYLLKKVDRGERGGQKLLILRRHCLWTAPKNYLDSEHFLSRRPSFGQKRKLSVELPNGHFTLTKQLLAWFIWNSDTGRLACPNVSSRSSPRRGAQRAKITERVHKPSLGL